MQTAPDLLDPKFSSESKDPTNRAIHPGCPKIVVNVMPDLTPWLRPSKTTHPSFRSNQGQPDRFCGDALCASV
jgi:hypothetical protein